jgi:transposase
MSRKRRVFGASFKAKVACRGDKTTAELASQFGVHAGQVTAWKKQLLEQASELFEDGRRSRREDRSADEEALYAQIGRLKMELEWLKKICRAPAAVKRRLQVLPIDPPHKRQVLRRLALPLVAPRAPRQLEQLALPRYAQRRMLRFDPATLLVSRALRSRMWSQVLDGLAKNKTTRLAARKIREAIQL